MADSAVAVTAGTGTNIDTRTEGTNGNHRQVIVVGDPGTNAGVAAVDATKGLSVNLENTAANATAIKVDGSAVTQPVSHAALTELAGAIDTEMQVDIVSSALPSGAATAAKQDTGNTSLASIDGKITAVNTGAVVLAAGNANVGDVDVASIAAGNNNIGNVDVETTVTPANRTASGSLTAADQAATLTPTGVGQATVQITGTWVATVVFEASVDGTNFFSVNAIVPTTGAIAASATANGQWLVSVAGYNRFRVRCSAYTSGTIVVSIEAAQSEQVVTLGNAIPTGANAIGKLAANSGVDIGDVDVTSSALPTGAATSAKQDTAQTSLDTIAGDTTSIQTAVELIDDTVATDGAATPTKGILMAGQDGTNAQTLKTDSTGALQIDVESSALPTGAATLAEQQTQTASLSVLDDWDNGASDGASVSGDVAHGAADAGEPVKLGAKVETSLATVTTEADGDRTNLYADSDGTLLVRSNFPLGDLKTDAISNTDGASTASSVFTGVASTRNVITAINVFRTDAGTTPIYIDFRDGTGGSVLWRMVLPPNGGSIITDPTGLFRTSANTALAYDVSAATTTVYINTSGFQSKV